MQRRLRSNVGIGEPLLDDPRHAFRLLRVSRPARSIRLDEIDEAPPVAFVHVVSSGSRHPAASVRPYRLQRTDAGDLRLFPGPLQ